MARKMKVGDIVESPQGLIEIIKFSKNGLCLFKRLYPCENSDGANLSSIVRTYPIRERPRQAPPKRQPLYGYGVIGDGPHRSSENGIPTIGYRAWRSMLQRVYAPKDKSTERTYGDVEVCSEWLVFQNFAEWYYRQLDAYQGWQKVPFKWVVDKDLLVPMNRIYSPAGCCVIPQPVNSVLTFRRTSPRMSHVKLPLGVSPGRDGGMPFVAYCSHFQYGLQFLGFFRTVREAQNAYWSAKFRSIRDVTVFYWNYMPESLAMRLIHFNFDDVRAYYGNDPYVWGYEIIA